MGWLSVSLDAVHDIPAASEILRVPPNAAPFLKHRQRISVLDGFGWFWYVFVVLVMWFIRVYQSLSYLLAKKVGLFPQSTSIMDSWIHTPQVKSRLSHNRFHHVSPWHGIIGSFTVNSLSCGLSPVTLRLTCAAVSPFQHTFWGVKTWTSSHLGRGTRLSTQFNAGTPVAPFRIQVRPFEKSCGKRILRSAIVAVIHSDCQVLTSKCWNPVMSGA